LIHEGTFLDDLRGRSDAVRKRHSTTAEALNVAHNANAEACILTHFSQRYRHMSIENVSSGQDSHPFSWGIAFDGMMVPFTERALSGLTRLSQCIDSLIQQSK
jgi:ribonuclease BN (tRNA processing enzyme)